MPEKEDDCEIIPTAVKSELDDSIHLSNMSSNMHVEEQQGMQDNMVEHYDDCGEYVAELMDDEYYTSMEGQGGQENTGAGESVDSEGERILPKVQVNTGQICVSHTP